MPLSRYEIRSEYSLANPDLYRVADKDDPEGLLEGVAMAGLVGIIRQLGDLAEFAGEVFHDLHEDILVIASRGHELLMRVQQLETEVPLIEDLMLTKDDDGNYFYNPGLEWHTHIHNEQNHFTQGDLPRFVRSAYEDCRSPPRLFVLDRFDVVGAGACLKRFTDPSFFKMEWASSELMKAEKEQRDQKARRMKKKGRRQGNGEVREARPTSHIQLREQIEVEDTASLSIRSSSSDFSLGFDQAVDSLKRESNGTLSASGLFSPEQEGQSKAMPAKDSSFKELASESLDLQTKLSTLDTLSHMDVDVMKEDLEIGLGEVDVVADDSASETDNFMDAVTTMDSEVETDSEMKARVEVDGESLTESEELEAPVQLNLPSSEHPRGADEEHVVIEEDKEHFIIEEDKEHLIIEENKESFVMQEESPSGDLISGESLRTEHALGIGNAPTVVAEEENSCFVDRSIVGTSVQDNDASTPNSCSGTSLFGLWEDGVAKSEEDGVAKLEEDGVAKSEEDGVAKLEEDGVAKSGEYFVDNASTGFAKELDSSAVNKSVVATIQDSDVATSISRSVAVSPCIGDVVSNPDGCLQSGSMNIVLETPETLEADNNDMEKLPADFNHLPDVLGKDLPVSESPKALGALTTTRKRWQISTLFNKESLASDLDRNSLEASESEQSESPKKPSPQSSPSSSIQPMSWAMRSYHTDDEMDGMQVSSASPSSSSSTVSTPRPSTLATPLRNMGLEIKPQSPLFPQKSADSSPRSLVSSPSGINTVPYEPVPDVKTTAEPLISPASEDSTHSSPHSSSSSVQPFFDSLPFSGLDVNTSNAENLAEQFSAQSLSVNNLEIFPPPPPLPPLAWCMTRSHNNLVYPSKPRDSPTSPRDVRVLPDELSQGFTSSTTVHTVPLASVVIPNGLTQACNSTVQPTAQKFEVMPDESLQSFTHATGPSDLQTSHVSYELPQVSEPAGSHKRASLSVISNADTVEQTTVSVLEPSDLKGEDLVTVQPDRSSQEKFIVGSTRVFPSRVLRTESTPARLDDSRLGLQTKAADEYGSSPLQRQDSPSTLASNFERGDFFVEATTSRDMNRLKQRSKWALTSSTASSDDREVLLEQIRTRSFNLRHTSAEKLAAPRPVTNINVAAILEKANAIRQAFAGSDEDDEDDEWSDA